MLSVKNLFLKYTREYFALYDINIDVKNGERVALVGEEDSGKTSLLRILAKLEDFTSGEVYLKDIPLKKINFLNDISVGYVPASPVFLENKTVEQNLKFILKQRKLSSAEIESKINKAYIDFSLEKLKNEKVKDLKLIDKYILSFVRLSFREIELLLIDNIFDKLEEREKEEIIKLISDIFSVTNTTVLVATTKEDIADKLAKRKIYFANGSIVG